MGIFHGYFRGFLGSFLVSQKNGVNFMVNFRLGFIQLVISEVTGVFLLSDGILVGGLVAMFYFSH